MRLIYMGSPDFAVPPFLALLKAGHDIPLVVSQPDKPKGRRRLLTPTPVKEAALKRGVPVLTPASVNTPEFVAYLKALKPELLVVAAFGQILKKPLLELAPKGAVNIHASLLPFYRGAAPIHWAIINGETQTGITTMFMDVGLDTGDIILQRSIEIMPEDDTGSLYDKLSCLGADLIVETVSLLAENKAPRRPQGKEGSSYAPRILREEESIAWQKPAREVFNKIRGLSPWPLAYAIWQDKEIKIVSARLVPLKHEYAAGSVISANKDGVLVACAQDAVLLTKLCPAGKKPMAAGDFWCGQSEKTGFWY